MKTLLPVFGTARPASLLLPPAPLAPRSSCPPLLSTHHPGSYTDPARPQPLVGSSFLPPPPPPLPPLPPSSCLVPLPFSPHPGRSSCRSCLKSEPPPLRPPSSSSPPLPPITPPLHAPHPGSRADPAASCQRPRSSLAASIGPPLPPLHKQPPGVTAGPARSCTPAGVGGRVSKAEPGPVQSCRGGRRKGRTRGVRGIEGH